MEMKLTTILSSYGCPTLVARAQIAGIPTKGCKKQTLIDLLSAHAQHGWARDVYQAHFFLFHSGSGDSARYQKLNQHFSEIPAP